MKKTDKILNLVLPLITIGCIILVWSVSAKVIGSEYILPSVTDTMRAFFGLFIDKKFYLNFSLTLLRSLIAFIVSFVLAGLCAFFAYKSKRVERVTLTIMSVLRALPTVAIVLLLLFWTNSQVAPVIVTMLVVMPTTYTHLKSAFSLIDKSVIEAGMVDGANKSQTLLKIELPLLAPAVYSAIGSGVSLNFKLMVAAEVLSATVKSLGSMLNTAKYDYELALMLAMVIAVVAFGIIVETIFNKISRLASEGQ